MGKPQNNGSKKGAKIQWKAGGAEDNYVLRKIKDGNITKHTTPAELKKMQPDLFHPFSDNVIRNHLNDLKRREATYLNRHIDDDSDDSGPPPASSSSTTKTNDANLTHNNYPTLIREYKDPTSGIKKVVVVVSLPGGCKDVDAHLNSEGTVVTINYSWPNTMFDFEDMFRKPIAAKVIDKNHPKILALFEGLENVAPRAHITVNLPFSVQTHQWEKNGLSRPDGTLLFVAEFTDCVSEYSKKLKDNRVVFDM